MMNGFDIKRDIEIINAGGFFCQACLVGKTKKEASPDPRYCQGCHNLLLKEAKLLGHRAGEWKPVKDNSNPDNKAQGVCDKIKRANDVDLILSHPSNDEDKGNNAGKTRGRKGLELPLGFIKEQHIKGVGSRKIAQCLEDQGIEVSYKTIQRVIKKDSQN